MRIGLDARYLHDHFPGIGRYVAGLARGLSMLDHGHTLVLLVNPALAGTRQSMAGLPGQPRVELVETQARPFSLAEQWQIARLARDLRLDLLHSPYYLKPFAGLPCPSLVTIYDLIGLRFPAALPARGRLAFRLLTALAVRTSQRIITCSHHSAADLAALYRVAPARIAVTPLAADAQFAPPAAAQVAALRSRYDLPLHYVLYLGANKPHKNLERLVWAWELLVREEFVGANSMQPRLVIAGHEDLRYPAVRHLAAERGLSHSVIFLPNLPDTDLPALYGGATLFVFPSLYEGFGLPPLEALACGTPVACSNASSLPEVVGEAALSFDPRDTGAIAAAIRTALADPALRARLREAGLRRAACFSWERTAHETLRVYEAVSEGQ